MSLILFLLGASLLSLLGQCHTITDTLRKDTITSSVVINTTCLTVNCGSSYETCLLQPKCNQLLTCLEKCLDGFDRDDSLMKSTTQACARTCTFSYADFYYTGFSRCLTDNHCLQFPRVDTKCRRPNGGGLTPSRKFQISDVKGGWWVARGYNPAYDCVPCQHIFFDAFQYMDNQFAYRPTFEAVTVNGSHSLVNGSIYDLLQNNKPGEVIQLDYYLYGIPEHYIWQVLDGPADNSTILVYYCGDVATNWNIEGAMILTRSPVLPPEADVMFAELVKKNIVDMEYELFCKPQLDPCPN